MRRVVFFLCFPKRKFVKFLFPWVQWDWIFATDTSESLASTWKTRHGQPQDQFWPQRMCAEALGAWMGYARHHSRSMCFTSQFVSLATTLCWARDCHKTTISPSSYLFPGPTLNHLFRTTVADNQSPPILLWPNCLWKLSNFAGSYSALKKESIAHF